MSYTNAFEFPDTIEKLGMDAWRSAGDLLAPDVLNDGFCLTNEQRLCHENAALTDAVYRERARAEAAEAALESFRDQAASMEKEFNRVRDRALDMVMSRMAEAERLKKEVGRLTDECARWGERFEAVRQSAVRMMRERDAALAATAKSRLSADAPEFLPSSSSLKEAVRARLAALGKTPAPGSC